MSHCSAVLGDEYRRLFDTLEVRSTRAAEVDRLVDQPLGLKPR